MSVTTDEILSAVDAIQDEAISFLKTVASIDSTLEAGEGKVQSAIYSHLLDVLGAEEVKHEERGDDVNNSKGGTKRKRKNLFEVQRIPVRLDEIQNQRGFSPVDWAYDDSQKFDVVARYQNQFNRDDDNTENEGNSQDGGGRSLLLLGHVDVVPANESDGWTHPPFSPIIRDKDVDGKIDKRMYGRGTGDMKAGVVGMIYAVVALRRLRYVPRGDLSICTVVEEECTGNGALAAPLRTLLPIPSASSISDEASDLDPSKTAVIIPEPFPYLVTAQLGVLWFRASITGKPCHVLQTSAGCNAIEGAYKLYSALKGLEEKYNEPRGDAHPAYKGMDHPVNFNLGKIEGGNWASSVPSSCWFEARVGFFPGVKIEDVKRDVENVLYDAAKNLGLGLEISYSGFHAEGAVLLSEYANGRMKTKEEKDSGTTSLQKEFVNLLQRSHKLASSPPSAPENDKPQLPLKPITCTTDARFYSSLYHDPEKVVVTCFGPEASNIHGVDESVSLKSMRDVTATIALFIRDWCGLTKEGG